jgi:hypothetical protein
MAGAHSVDQGTRTARLIDPALARLPLAVDLTERLRPARGLIATAFGARRKARPPCEVWLSNLSAQRNLRVTRFSSIVAAYASR